MDETDVAILRELGRDQVGGWGRLDPRVPASAIAREIDVARSTVSTRLARWEETGFLVGYDLWPNPGLFDAVHGAASLRVDDPPDRGGVISSLTKMEGVLGILDHVGPWIGVGLIGDDVPAIDRTVDLLAGLRGVDSVEASPPYEPPTCEAELSAMDRRIVDALRADPTGSDRDVADRVGISSRTFRRRYRRLVDADALLQLLELDFRRWTGSALVRFLVHLDPDAERVRAAREVEEVLGACMFIHNSLRPQTEHPWPILDSVAHLPAVAEAADRERHLLGLDVVEEVEVLLPRTLRTVDHWLEQRLSHHRDAETGAEADASAG